MVSAIVATSHQFEHNGFAEGHNRMLVLLELSLVG